MLTSLIMYVDCVLSIDLLTCSLYSCCPVRNCCQHDEPVALHCCLSLVLSAAVLMLTCTSVQLGGSKKIL